MFVGILWLLLGFFGGVFIGTTVDPLWLGLTLQLIFSFPIMFYGWIRILSRDYY